MRPQSKRPTATRTSSQRKELGFTLVEILIATAIIAISGLGVAVAINNLKESRTKAQLVSQSVGLEAAVIAAIQDPATYSVNQALVTALNSPTGPAPAANLQPTLTLNLPSPQSGQINQISVTAGGPTVYVDGNYKQIMAPAGTNWNMSIVVSAIGYVNGHYAYTYQVLPNPALGVAIARAGPKNLVVPSTAADDLTAIPIPKEIIQVANIGAGAQQACSQPPNSDLAMLGLDSTTGAPICVHRSMQKCPKTSIAKGFMLVKDSSNGVYSYEFNCMPLYKLSCPTVIVDAGVPDASYPTAYALQSFDPNSLDESSATGATGKCVFVASATSSSHSPNTYENGVTVTAACPPHYHPTLISCNVAPDATPPPVVTCASSVPADPSKYPPSGTVVTYPDSRSIQCQVQETQACCGDNHAICANPWQGTAKLTYSCSLNPGLETVTAISSQ